MNARLHSPKVAVEESATGAGYWRIALTSANVNTGSFTRGAAPEARSVQTAKSGTSTCGALEEAGVTLARVFTTVREHAKLNIGQSIDTCVVGEWYPSIQPQATPIWKRTWRRSIENCRTHVVR